MTFTRTDARTDLRPTRHVVIYPDGFWANALRAPRHSGYRPEPLRVSAIRRVSAFAMWATFAVCFALIASGAL
jgi:hypothetical protein